MARTLLVKSAACAAIALAWIACKSSIDITATSSSTGWQPPPGDCASDADCPGGRCVPITVGGYAVCSIIPPEATSCMTPGADECCTTNDCPPAEKCYPPGAMAHCGLPGVPGNTCSVDECVNDDNCAHTGAPSICAPAGAWGQPARTCLTAYCKTNEECTAEPGGLCTTVENTCCKVPIALACVYPGGCHKASDCPDAGGGASCALDMQTGRGVCAGPVGCAH